MGIFSFLKNAGAKLFNREDAQEDKAAKTTTRTVDPAAAAAAHQRRVQALEKAVRDHGIDVNDLRVGLEGSKVIVNGEVDSQAEKEKVVLILGNVEGIETVDDRMTVAKPEPESQFHEVQKGDSLSKIAKKYYGDAMKYPVIFEANKPMLKDPDKIYPGQMLRIPPVKQG